MADGWSTCSFFALVQTNVETLEPQRIVTNNSLQAELTTLFDEQADVLVGPDIDRVPFDGRYCAGQSEVFEIESFDLPAQIEEAIRSPESVPLLRLSRVQPTIKAIYCGSFHAATGSIYGVFQEFNSGRLLTKSRTLLHSQDTFHKLAQNGLILADRAEAVFDGDTVYFQSYYKTNRFLSLIEYFHDATDAEIREVFASDRLIAEDEDETLATSDQWMRRRFGIIVQTGILGKVSARKIRASADNCKLEDLTVNVKRVNGKEAVVLPKEKRAAKRVLTFLCEGIFHGELTNQLFISNSHRPASAK